MGGCSGDALLGEIFLVCWDYVVFVDVIFKMENTLFIAMLGIFICNGRDCPARDDCMLHCCIS